MARYCITVIAFLLLVVGSCKKAPEDEARTPLGVPNQSPQYAPPQQPGTAGAATARGIVLNGAELLARDYVPYGPQVPGSEPPPLTGFPAPDPEAAKARREALGYLTGTTGHYDLDRAAAMFAGLAAKGDPYSIMYEGRAQALLL